MDCWSQLNKLLATFILSILCILRVHKLAYLPIIQLSHCINILDKLTYFPIFLLSHYTQSQDKLVHISVGIIDYGNICHMIIIIITYYIKGRIYLF